MPNKKDEVLHFHTPEGGAPQELNAPPQVEGVPDAEQSVDTSLGTPERPWEGEHEWDKDAKKLADIKLEKDITQTKSDFLESRYNLNTSGQESQYVSDMKKYSDRQSAQRAGWTGGYVLDQTRQRSYLKESIAAQMYGAMELQTLGYESQLSAARLAYDLGKEQLAMERYKQAYEQSIMRGELTGTWVSPEILDIVTQFDAALNILEGYDDTSEDFIPDGEYERATALVQQIETWFAQNNIEPSSIPALSRTIAQQQIDLDREILSEGRIQRALDSKESWQHLLTDENNNVLLDENGRPMIIDLSNAQPEDALEFYQKKPTALKQYIESLAERTISDFLRTVNTDEMTNEQLEIALEKYLQSRDLARDYLDDLGEEAYALIDGGYVTALTVGGKTFDFSFGNVGDQPDQPGGERDDDVIKDALNNDPMAVIIDLPDLLGFGIETQSDLLDLYGTSFGNITEMAADYYSRINSIDTVLSGTYTSEQAAEALTNFVWLSERKVSDMDLSGTGYDDNRHAKNAYVTHQTFNFIAEQGGFEPDAFSWNWDIQTGDSIFAGIYANSVTGKQIEFLESLGFVKVERGRTLWLQGTGDEYYALGTKNPGFGVPPIVGMAGRVSTSNYTNAFIEYLQQNASTNSSGGE